PRPEGEDEIDRIMRAAAADWTSVPPPSGRPARSSRPAESVKSDAAKVVPGGTADPKPSPPRDEGKRDSPMNPAHADPFAPPAYPARPAPAPQPVQMQPWYDQQAA